MKDSFFVLILLFIMFGCCYIYFLIKRLFQKSNEKETIYEQQSLKIRNLILKNVNYKDKILYILIAFIITALLTSLMIYLDFVNELLRDSNPQIENYNYLKAGTFFTFITLLIGILVFYLRKYKFKLHQEQEFYSSVSVLYGFISFFMFGLLLDIGLWNLELSQAGSSFSPLPIGIIQAIFFLIVILGSKIEILYDYK